MDSAGNLYGTTSKSGAILIGAVFKVTPTGAETVLHSFTPGTGDGQSPVAGLILDSAGNLSGTAPNGGASGAGTVFKAAN